MLSTDTLKFNTTFFKEFWVLFKPYWRSAEKWGAFGLLFLSVCCIFGDIIGNIGFNFFHRDFFNALQAFDKAGIIKALVHFVFIVILYSIALSCTDYFLGILGNRWRKWLTQDFLKKWLSEKRFYHPKSSISIDNPDQRISEDLDSFTTLTLSLFRKFLHSILILVTFCPILWSLSSKIVFNAGKTHFTIPGYFCLMAVVCAIVGTWLIKKIGKKLPLLDYQQQHYNADFRFSLIRLRETDEPILSHNSESAENNQLDSLFHRIFKNMKQIVALKSFLSLFNHIYAFIYYIISFVISLPFYLSKMILLGNVTQISSAFNSVASGFSVIVEAYSDLANWRSVIFRLSELNQYIDRDHNYTSTMKDDATIQESFS